jgi:hypothetical protein
VKTAVGCIVVGIRWGTTQMSGWTRPQLFWTMLSRCQRLYDAHVADARIRDAWRIRQPLPYTCVRMVSCQAMRCGKFHGESGTRVIAEEELDYDAGVDRMDEMLEAMQAEVTEDPPTAEVEAFFKLLKASEESLHEHTEVTLLAFITQLMAIKYKYFFSNNCYNDLVKLISDILLKPHKEPKDMYQSKKLMSSLGIKYEKIDVYPDNCMLFWKEHTNEKKCLKCGQSRFVEVVTQDGETVTTEVAHKQLHYFPITPRLKQLLISKRTVRHMR